MHGCAPPWGESTHDAFLDLVLQVELEFVIEFLFHAGAPQDGLEAQAPVNTIVLSA